MNRFVFLSGLIILVFLASLSLAEIPRLINYQGMLTQTDGTPLDGTPDLTFKIYGSLSGDDSLWWEYHTGVTVTNGLFNVILGSISSFSSSIFDDTVRYLGIKVGTDLELSPRVRLTSVGYAYRSLVADSAIVAVSAPTGGGWTDDETVVRLETSTDSVGIGTSSPEAKLHVQGSNEILFFSPSSGGYPQLKVGKDRNENNNIILGFDNTNNYGYLGVAGDPSNTFVVKDGGNIGIGIDDPQNKLHIHNPSGTEISYAQFTNPTTGTQPTDGFFVGINSSGNAFISNHESRSLTIRTNNTDRIHIESDGDVGIGTTSPAQKLDVAGTVQMTGFKLPTGASNGYILTSDGSGVGTWQAISGAGSNWTATDSVLYTNKYWGIARGGANNILYGDSIHTMVNLGVSCTTGASGQNYKYCTIGGGDKNIASAERATVGGGNENRASGWAATVAGGYWNLASGQVATVGGGEADTASADYTTVAGGTINRATAQEATVGGGYDNLASNNAATVAGGDANTASGSYAAVGGGSSNTASAYNTTVGGGYLNTATQHSATIGGGNHNSAEEDYSTVAGGWYNTASGYTATVGGGYNNTASDTSATVGGGESNHATNEYATVSGGRSNLTSGLVSTIGGGRYNKARGQYSVVSGGGGDVAADSNSALGDYSAIGGGKQNIASGTRATIGGGWNNNASGYDATVGGGKENSASSGYSTVAGGAVNSASNLRATVGGGISNTASGQGATITGGEENTASGNYTSIGGGALNEASASYATIPGGYADTVAGTYSFAAGYKVRVGSGANFTFAYGRDFTTSTPNAVIFYNSVSEIKVGIDTTSPGNIITVKKESATDPIADAWTTYSSARWKENINPIENALDKVLALRGVYFDWKESKKHDIGMIAEEVGKVVPEVVAYEENGVDAKSLDYGRLTTLLVEAIKEQQKEIESLKEKINTLEKGIR